MDIFNFIIMLVVLAFAIQYQESWVVLGLASIMIVSDMKPKFIFIILLSVGVLYYINSIGLKEYWLIATVGLILVAYLLGIGKEQAPPADPYGGLLGGLGGMGGGAGGSMGF
jgi:hypothetical protein